MNTEHDRLVGERVRQVMKRHKMSQQELAEQLGYREGNTISLIVRGKRSLTAEKARKMVELFPEVRLDWLLGKTDYQDEREEKLLAAADVLAKRQALCKALNEFFSAQGSIVVEPFDSLLFAGIGPRYTVIHGDKVLLLSVPEMDNLLSFVRTQIEAQIDFLLRQEEARAEARLLDDTIKKAIKADRFHSKQELESGGE